MKTLIDTGVDDPQARRELMKKPVSRTNKDSWDKEKDIGRSFLFDHLFFYSLHYSVCEWF